jgi:hypothetical protein
MGTATSERVPVRTRVRAGAGALAAAGALAIVTGCGAAGQGSAASSSRSRPAVPPVSAAPARSVAPFSWLSPGRVPAGWRLMRIPSGATAFYPPNWGEAHGDPGTATAQLLNASGGFVGYLNLTPRQSAETVANWRTFRPRHNAREGDRLVRLEGAAQGLRFRSGAGACVRDSYETQRAVRFIELACLGRGSRQAAVIVAAAPAAVWPRERQVLQQAIDSFAP